MLMLFCYDLRLCFGRFGLPNVEWYFVTIVSAFPIVLIALLLCHIGISTSLKRKGVIVLKC